MVKVEKYGHLRVNKSAQGFFHNISYNISYNLCEVWALSSFSFILSEFEKWGARNFNN